MGGPIWQYMYLNWLAQLTKAKSLTSFELVFLQLDLNVNFVIFLWMDLLTLLQQINFLFHHRREIKCGKCNRHVGTYCVVKTFVLLR